MSTAPLFDMSQAQPIQSAPPLFDMSKAQVLPSAMPGAPPPKGTLPNKGDTGEGPVAKNLTSFETQLSTIPEGLVKLVLAKHWPVVDAKDWTELGNDFKSLNPVVKSDGQTDWGATAANILPMLADVKGGGITESPAANLVKSVGAPAVRSAAAMAAGAGGSLLDNDVMGIISPRAAHVGGMLSRAADVLRPTAAPTYPGAPYPENPGVFPGAPFPENPGVFPGAPFPETPPSELLQARPLTQGGAAPPADPAAALSRIPQRFTPPATPTPDAAPVMPEPMSTAPNGNTIPRTLSGESALRQILGGQDNANLLKIAKSRGINVTQEAQLKPGVADARLIGKIVNDFSPDELENVGATYLENTRMGKHSFGDIGPEAWKTMGMQTYFPDVKIPSATLNRVGKAVSSAAPAAGDDSLLNQLQESLKQVRGQKLAEAQ